MTHSMLSTRTVCTHTPLAVCSVPFSILSLRIVPHNRFQSTTNFNSLRLNSANSTFTHRFLFLHHSINEIMHFYDIFITLPSSERINIHPWTENKISSMLVFFKSLHLLAKFKNRLFFPRRSTTSIRYSFSNFII